MKNYTVQVSLTNALVSFLISANTLDEALVLGRKNLAKITLFDDNLEVLDYSADVTGVY